VHKPPYVLADRVSIRQYPALMLPSLRESRLALELLNLILQQERRRDVAQVLLLVYQRKAYLMPVGLTAPAQIP
jgi:hypothetical protein